MRYPNGIKKEYQNKIKPGNRGMDLEYLLNETNQYYLKNNIAVIYKKPTPIIIHKVDYSNKKDAVITEAHFLIPSTTDYNGIYQGKYIDFEAKETRKEYFPLSNIHAHQIEHLKRISEHGGISFIIVLFTLQNKIYLLETKYLLQFIQESERRSIPKDFFQQYGYIIPQGYNPYLDYLRIIKEWNK